jgi:hypothetical protein
MIKRTFQCEVMLDCTVSYEQEPGVLLVKNPVVIALIPIKALKAALLNAETEGPASGGFARVDILGALLKHEAGSVENRCEDDARKMKGRDWGIIQD